MGREMCLLLRTTQDFMTSYHAAARVKVCLCTCVMSKGKGASVNCLIRGGSVHPLSGICSGPAPHQSEAGTEIGTRSRC